MYEILQVLDMAGSFQTHSLYVDSGTREKDSPEVEKPPPWKDTVAHTTLRRILRDTHTSSPQLILHFWIKVSS
jgi:hypothetical protein